MSTETFPSPLTPRPQPASVRPAGIKFPISEVPEFKGNLKAFRSDLLVDKDAERVMAQKPRDPVEVKKFAADDAYHYYGSPIWYTRIGIAISETMLDLLKAQGK